MFILTSRTDTRQKCLQAAFQTLLHSAHFHSAPQLPEQQTYAGANGRTNTAKLSRRKCEKLIMKVRSAALERGRRIMPAKGQWMRELCQLLSEWLSLPPAASKSKRVWSSVDWNCSRINIKAVSEKKKKKKERWQWDILVRRSGDNTWNQIRNYLWKKYINVWGWGGGGERDAHSIYILLSCRQSLNQSFSALIYINCLADRNHCNGCNWAQLSTSSCVRL